MIDSLIILSYFSLIVVLQSVIGVGILVLGTPFLLLLNYNIIDIFFILLPISILTSLSNLLIMNFHNNVFKKSTSKEFKKFFIICIPSIIIGLLILKFFQNYINFKVLVSLVIIFSVFLVILKDKIQFRINFFRISILSIVGVIHGLTNSGGTLMSLTLSTNKNKDYARFNITFFYLILASFQYLVAVIIFYEDFNFPKSIGLILFIFLGIFIGNIFNNYIDYNKYKIVINILALLSSLMLLLN